MISLNMLTQINTIVKACTGIMGTYTIGKNAIMHNKTINKKQCPCRFFNQTTRDLQY
jgi:hypothetical protein